MPKTFKDYFSVIIVTTMKFSLSVEQDQRLAIPGPTVLYGLESEGRVNLICDRCDMDLLFVCVWWWWVVGVDFLDLMSRGSAKQEVHFVYKLLFSLILRFSFATLFASSE